MVAHSSPERGTSVQVRLDPLMKRINTLLVLKKFLKQEGMISGTQPNIKELLDFLQKIKKGNKPIRLMYGETYDSFGITIDSLKYYLFLSVLHRTLEQGGFIVESTILVADTASVLNSSVKNKDSLLQDGIKRLEKINKIIQIYSLKTRVVLMSELFKNIQVKNAIKEVSIYAQSSKIVQNLFEKTVLQNKISQERGMGYQYASEAVATALQFDIKIGPPREIYYDQSATIIGKDLNLGMVYGIYLKPTYPLGKDFSFFISNPEIEEFGITPYKAGSNKLQDFRIVLGSTSQEVTNNLIINSFISKDLTLANPVVDLYFIAELAKSSLERNTILPFYSNGLIKDVTEFRLQTIDSLRDFVFEPLYKGEFYE